MDYCRQLTLRWIASKVLLAQKNYVETKTFWDNSSLRPFGCNVLILKIHLDSAESAEAGWLASWKCDAASYISAYGTNVFEDVCLQVYLFYWYTVAHMDMREGKWLQWLYM